jgi:transcriptional regulator with XRE-family HTH domain
MVSRHPGGRPRQVKVCEWGKRLEALAAARGWNRSDLATKAGITPPSMWALCTGKSKPKFETICKIADALGVPLAKLR